MILISAKKWFVVNTAPASESKVLQNLKKKSISCYLPMLNIKKQHWDGYISLTKMPLFPRILFVKITDSQVSSVLKCDGVKNLLYWHSSYAILKDEEIDIIKNYINCYEKVWVKKIQINPTSGNSLESQNIDSIRKNILPGLGYEIYASGIDITTVSIRKNGLVDIPETVND